MKKSMKLLVSLILTLFRNLANKYLKSVALEDTNNVIQQQAYRLEDNKNKVKLLLEVPCGDEYSSYKFIKDAHNAQRNVIVIEQNLIELREEAEELYENIESLKPESIDRKIEKYESVLEIEDSIYNDINQNELIIKQE